MMVMNANGGADASHKRRLENRLMMRRRDPQGSRQRGPRSSKNFRVSVKVKINIAVRLRASRHIKVLI
jgi:hypothetical protein